MGQKLLTETLSSAMEARRRQFGFFDDFLEFCTNVAETTTVLNTFTRYTVTASDNGSVATDDAHGGVINCRPMNATTEDNNEIYVHQRNETLKFQANKPFRVEGRFKITAHNTTSLACTNFVFGVKDAWAADSITDDGGGPASSYSGALIGTVDGSSYYFCESSIATSQTTVTGDGSETGETPANGTWHVLAIEYRPISSTVGEVHFFVDDGTNGLVEIGLSSGDAHTVTFASATEMEVGFGLKAGSDHRHAVKCDYLALEAMR